MLKPLEDKLQEKKLLRKDLNNIFGYVTPYVPFVGILEGGRSVAGDVISLRISATTEEKTNGTNGVKCSDDCEEQL